VTKPGPASGKKYTHPTRKPFASDLLIGRTCGMAGAYGKQQCIILSLYSRCVDYNQYSVASITRLLTFCADLDSRIYDSSFPPPKVSIPISVTLLMCVEANWRMVRYLLRCMLQVPQGETSCGPCARHEGIGGVDAKLHSILTLALCWDEELALSPSRFTPLPVE
jgi:hypothetical protein